MTTTATASTRERLLDAAAELFYREGVGIGVEALCRTAGVSKRSMYQLFDSKDAVLAAVLQRRAASTEALLLPPEDDGRPPRSRILHVFEQLEAASVKPGYRGCPFLATEVELKNPEHPASRVARGAKQSLTDFFRTEGERGGAHDPALLARQLTLVFDGASARAGVGDEILDGLTTATVGTLLDAAGLSGPEAR
ncbi:TetR family transcriptional regulator [Streptomyces lunaelactis]|uniref:TetR family transcriptional regulator n=1 Tax=Streptomyces lunaelactis TaxID=1535768 RepID=A0A2R4SWU6_9ACTN|nr:TetR/AcrR family transcriptional regulator [Streptomyces lunaelactis]AVZ71322.1 TetR family transcriptional regulator [Streptomyces lunaelactis]NUJ99897.1 TetR/AcrR family transcriptional regulator [Streptomyces lunaelactis]NUK07092.1 TetR/AcrR family transcriptional regulator [Streptomyces lunaelactis]NUK15285.1 TetR/AcrR family transcriptional regulator [Streptomyces lunaelactis]NUK22011.1 TetR/AcrR family transcriptional regulator [Streptomyces lunaelactis]